ncbi:MAG TPA: patatin-like phospholipase family protein [Gemmatimonadaceae bacterium]
MTRAPHPAHAPPPRRIALVLGGGGMKGFAHIGVMRALEERGITPTVYAGTSIGAMLGAARVGGISVPDLEARAVKLRRRDLFRLNHFGMLMERMRSPSIYLEEPLRELCRSVVPDGTFDDLALPLLVNTVDLERGMPVIWGSPGLRDVAVQDAVYASCALPGFFPPGRVGGRLCMDGGVIDNLPVGVASLSADLIIAVDVGSNDLRPIDDAMSLGFANIYMRAATTMMHALQQFPLTHWDGPPMVLIRPRCTEDWLSFSNIAETIQEGYRAALKALEDIDAFYDQPGGVYPRRRFELEVDRDKCIGCGLCVALAPNLMGLDADGKAYPRTRTVDWSPADGDFVQFCPTSAIVARKTERIVPLKAGERGAA